MIFKVSMIVGILSSLVLLSEANGPQRISFKSNIEPDLALALEEATPHYSNLLSKHLENLEKVHFRSVAYSTFNTKLRDIYFRGTDSDVNFENVIIKEVSPVKIDKLVPRLRESVLDVSAHWDEVVFEGSFVDVASADFTNRKNLLITLRNVEAKGVAGFIVDENVPMVTNLKLDFSLDSINIKDASTGEDALLKDSGIIDNIINDYFSRDIRQVLRENLKDYLDSVLSEFPLDEVFGGNKLILRKYNSAIIQRSSNANDLADFLLDLLKSYFAAHGYSTIELPDLNYAINHKWGLINLKGTFEAIRGSLKDLTSIRRTGQFSIDGNFETDQFRLFGSLGFTTLEAHYEYYRVLIGWFKPNGILDVKVGQNSVNFDISGKVENEKFIHVSDFHIRIQQFDGIKAKATGLSVVLNWLWSIIVTKVVNGFKGTIVNVLNEHLHDKITGQLNATNWVIPLSP